MNDPDKIGWRVARELRHTILNSLVSTTTRTAVLSILDACTEPEPAPRCTVHWINRGEGLGNIESMLEVDVPAFVKAKLAADVTYITINGRHLK